MQGTFQKANGVTGNIAEGEKQFVLLSQGSMNSKGDISSQGQTMINQNNMTKVNNAAENEDDAEESREVQLDTNTGLTGSQQLFTNEPLDEEYYNGEAEE